MTDADLDAIKQRAEDDGPGEPYECQRCGLPYDPERTCGEPHLAGDGCDEPDADDVCRDDRGRLLTEVDRLRAEVAAERARASKAEASAVHWQNVAEAMAKGDRK